MDKELLILKFFFIFYFLGYIPTKLKRSFIKLDLISKSNFELHPKEGAKFTSINQGFNYSSIKISKPNNSKHESL